MIRIIFVDDEPRVLDGLRRSLRAQSSRWDMTFAVGGRAALDALEGARFDVLVTDMRMPDIDGLALLTAAHERWPSMARIVLSGYMDIDVAVRATSVAHQFLAKPSEPDELESVIARTRTLIEILDQDAPRTVVGEVGTLATRPGTYTALDRVMGDANAGVRELAAIIEREVSLTAKLLQIANSSFFGFSRSVTSVSQAVSLLGMNVIRALVLSHEVVELAGMRRLAPELSLAAHQRHAIRVATLARAIAGGGMVADDAFLAGVLHDVGELVVAAHRPTWVADAAAFADAQDVPMHVAESAVVGVSHAEIGAHLVGLWGLPFRIVEAVAHHHLPSRAGSPGSIDALAAVHIADALVNEVDPAGRAICRGTVPALDAGYLESLGVQAQLDGWRALAMR